MEDREWADGLIAACLNRTDAEGPRIQLPYYLPQPEGTDVPRTQVPLRGRTSPELLLGIAEYATPADVDRIAARLREDRTGWSTLSMEARLAKLAESTRNVQRRRDRLITAEMLDIHKSLPEADGEVNEAIDFGTLAQAHYRELMKRENIDFTIDPERSLGLVICPKNFPVAIVKAHIDYLLARGYRVMVKPSTGEGEEAILSTWELIQTYRDAGIGEDVLAFVPCDNETAPHLVRQADEIRFTGSPGVAEIIHETNPEAVLFAETGGANWIIVDETMDPEDAALLIINANSGFAGQKCSAPRLVVLTEKVDREAIQRHLVRIQKTMLVGSPLTRWVDVTPLSKEHPIDTPFYRKVMEPMQGESWLLRPEKMGHPGIRVATDPKAFQPEKIDEIFAPIFTVVQIQGGVEEAVAYVNRLKGCITGGVYTDDQNKLAHAAQHAKAGNLYLGRRAITGALAHQAFGDGPGIAHRGVHGVKTGSLEMVAMTGEYRRKPGTHAAYNRENIQPDPNGLHALLSVLEESGSSEGSPEMQDAVHAGWSYLHEMQTYFSKQRRTPQTIVGQDDWMESHPIGHVVLRLNPQDSTMDILSKLFATIAAGNRLTISMPPEMRGQWTTFQGLLRNHIATLNPPQFEEDEAFAQRLAENGSTAEGQRIECVLYARRANVPTEVYTAAAQARLFIDARPVTGDGLIDMISQFRTTTYCHVFHNGGDTRYHDMREAKGLGLIQNPLT